MVSSAAYLTHVILTIANQIVIIIVIISPWTGDEIQFVTKDIRGNERLTEERTTLMKLFCAAERASGAGFSSTLKHFLSNGVISVSGFLHALKSEAHNQRGTGIPVNLNSP